MSVINSCKNIKLKEIANQAIDWAFANGLTMIKKPTEEESKNKIVTTTHLPFSLLPSRISKKLFQQSLSISKDYNLLVHFLSRDYNFIQNTLKDVQDEFTQKLLEIHRKIENEGVRQKISLGIFRSDYMIHQSEEKPRIYQVELNTISSSFGSLSNKVFELHKYILGFNQEVLKEEGFNYNLRDHPENNSLNNISDSLAKAFELYKENRKNSGSKMVVMMIVQSCERNLYDQKWIEITLWNKHKIHMIRRTMEEINDRGHIKNEDDGVLIIDNMEVAIAYYRAGYTPSDYHGEKEWNARLLVERSLAIKCPTISHHLVGVKKIQQVIARQGILEDYIKDTESLCRMRESFTGLYSLSKEDIDMGIVKKAIENPKNFVMKPQREGGGNNIYNEHVAQSLQTMSSDELSSYILMDKIVSHPFKAHIVRERELIEIEAIYELGIFGLLITENDRIHLNDEGGILLRTKTSTSDEGGVAAGFAVVDSPILY